METALLFPPARLPFVALAEFVAVDFLTLSAPVFFVTFVVEFNFDLPGRGGEKAGLGRL